MPFIWELLVMEIIVTAVMHLHYGWVNQGGYQTYYVWNPWYNYPTVISANAGPVTIPVPGGGFTWDNTITNW